MANPSGRIGREGEHQVVAYLKEAGFSDETEREGRRRPSLDVVGPDLRVPVESKRRKVLSVPAWTRELRERHGSTWALFLIARDKRRADAMPDVLVLPASLGALALKVLHDEGHL